MKNIYLKLFAFFLLLAVTSAVLPSCNSNFESEEENDEYDGPDKAAEFERKRNTDPTTGEVSYKKMWDAVLETENLKNIAPSSTASSNALAPLSWVERGSNSDAVGPSNGNSRPGGGVTSGRMRTLWVDLADPTGRTVWVGGISGGLWKTNDVTAAIPQWTLVNDYLSNLAVSGICQDPTNTNTMYFCTGESYFTGGGVGGVGVFKSTDHGITWTLLPSTSTLTRCTKVLCDAAGNVYVSTLGIAVAVGLQRSTNGGTSWVNINPFTTTSRIPDFEISSNGTMHVVGGLSSAAGIGGYAFTANPAAATPVWQSATTPYTIPLGNGARVEVECVGTTVYAAISNANKIDAIGKSVDGGLNWTTTSLTPTNVTDLNGGGQGVYSNGITVDPSNPSTVIIGSLRLLKSVDGGATFSKISEWVGTTGQYVHADVHNMAWYDNGNKLLVGTDGGLFYSTNKGTNFSDKNTGIRIKQFYGLSIHPTSTNYFLAGAQDNGTHQFNGPGLTSSIEVLGGDGGYTAIDLDEPQFQTGTYVYANFRRSVNGGATWSSSGSASTAGQFINPYDYDNVANKVYAGFSAGQYLKWDNPQTGFNFIPVTISAFGSAEVASATVSPYTANRVYFGLTNGKVIQVDNADQATPTAIDITPAGTAAGYVNSVIIGTSDQNLTVTLASAFVASTTSIWSTTNGGTSWTGIDGNLPEMPVYWALYHPDADTKMYLATEAGVFSTDAINGSSTVWTAESTFPTVKTSMLKYRTSDRTIAASTYGRGLWTATIPNGTCTPASITTPPSNVSICAGSNTSFTVTATGTPTLTYQWQVSTVGAGGPWTNLTNTAPYSNVTTATLNITGATVSLNNYQYRVIVTGHCAPLTATSNPAILTVNAAPAAPSVISPVTYCQGATAMPLTGTGNSLLWYTVASGGTGSSTAPTPSTSTPGTTVYYVSQTTSSCESPRAAITVTVNATPAAPTVISSVSFCQNSTATALSASGSNLLWYTNATGGTGSTTAPTPNTTTVGITVFYVSQTISNCESPRASITVNITATPAAPTVSSPIQYCQNVSAVPLTATGSNLLWYTSSSTGGIGSSTAPTPNTSTVGSTIYYVSQTTGCESPRASITVNVVAGTPAPTASSTSISYCQGGTATQLAATGSNLLWYTTATGGTGSTTAPTPNTATAGVTTFYVSQTSGSCESPRLAITVTVTATPAAPTATSPVNYCQNATATPLTATGNNLLWYTTATGGTGSITAPTPNTSTIGTTTYYVSQSTGTCEGPRASIVVNVSAVTAAPTVLSPVTYCQGAMAMPLTATGTGLLWYTASTGGTGSGTAPTPSTATVGSTTFYVSQTSNCGESPRALIVVNVTATPAAPTVTTPVTYCQGATATALTATGTGLLWYTTATGGTGSATAPTPSTATAGTTNYYVSQTTGACEGPRALLAIIVTAAPAAPTVSSPVNYCQNAATTPLTATGTNLLWYTTATGGTGSTTAPTPNTSVAGAVTYFVAQSNSCGAGARAAIVVNTTATPTVVTNLTATNITKTSAQLNWTGTAGSFYSIEYKTAAATTWTVAATGITNNTITVNNLTRGTTYNWRVSANCIGTGGGSMSAVASFTTTSRNTNIPSLTGGFGLRLTPNPIQSSGIVDYVVPENGTVTITVHNAAGQLIRSIYNANQSAGQYELNINNQLNTMSKGTYIIKLSQNKKGISLKFIKE